MPARTDTALMTPRCAAAVCLLLLPGPAGGAQPVSDQGAAAPPPPGAETRPEPDPAPTTVGPYRRIHPGYEDTGPLRRSLEREAIDFRTPSAFEHIYLAPDGSGRMMRVSGALHAVFPRSEYIATRFGAAPVVPSGTIYYLGPPEPPAADRARPRTGALVPAPSLRISAGTTSRAPRPAPRPATRQASAASDAPFAVMSDEPYRRRRIAAILQRALDAPQTP